MKWLETFIYPFSHVMLDSLICKYEYNSSVTLGEITLTPNSNVVYRDRMPRRGQIRPSGASRQDCFGWIKLPKCWGSCKGLCYWNTTNCYWLRSVDLYVIRRIGLIVYRGQTQYDRERKAWMGSKATVYGNFGFSERFFWYHPLNLYIPLLILSC